MPLTAIKTANLGESARWYSREGKIVSGVPNKSKPGEMRKPTLADARKLDLVPSVTTITKVLANTGLDQWKHQQVIESASTYPRPKGMSDADFFAAVYWESEQKGRETAERGQEIHGLIAKHWATLKPCNDVAVTRAMIFIGTTVPWNKGVTFEKPFACIRHYGGTIDMYWLNDELQTCIGDVKTVDLSKWKKPYDSHTMQIAAYRDAVCATNCYEFYVDRETGETVTYVWKPEELERGSLMFDACLKLWRAKNKVT